MIKLLLIDEKKNSIVVDLSESQFTSLGIDKDNIKEHSKRSDLNQTVTDFLNSFKNVK
jgi:hypothetical protein